MEHSISTEMFIAISFRNEREMKGAKGTGEVVIQNRCLWLHFIFLIKRLTWLLPCPGYCKQCCNDHWRACVFLNYGFLRVYAQQWDCCVTWQFYFQFFKASPYCSPQWLYQFTFLPTVQEGSLFSTPSPAFILWRFFDDGHSDWCEMISHCSFDLHFSND